MSCRLGILYCEFLISLWTFHQPSYLHYMDVYQFLRPSQQLLSTGSSIYQKTYIAEHHIQSLGIKMVHSFLKELFKKAHSIYIHIWTSFSNKTNRSHKGLSFHDLEKYFFQNFIQVFILVGYVKHNNYIIITNSQFYKTLFKINICQAYFSSLASDRKLSNVLKKLL